MLQITFPPRWEHIEPLREFVVEYSRLRFGDSVAERMRTLAQELIENAIKYGDPGDEPELTFSIDAIGRFELATVNRAVSSRIALLRQAFAQVVNPREALVTAMKRAPTLPPSQVMMGLARVRAETGVTLALEELGDSMVRIIARGGIT